MGNPTSSPVLEFRLPHLERAGNRKIASQWQKERQPPLFHWLRVALGGWEAFWGLNVLACFDPRENRRGFPWRFPPLRPLWCTAVEAADEAALPRSYGRIAIFDG